VNRRTNRQPSRAALLAAAVAAALGLASCQPAKSPATRAASRDDRGAPRAGMATGLELVRWFVPSDAARRKTGLERIVADGLAQRVACELDANGFTLLRADATRLAATLALLGESAAARSSLLGQPTSWTDLATAQVARGTPLFIAGRPATSEDSIMRLGLRGWCFPTVDSARARIELRLAQDADRVTTVTIDPSTVRARSTDVRSGRATLELAPNEALIILETPAIQPDQDDGDGPSTALPPTIASLILDGTPFPNRATVLVILPVLADILPPGAPSVPPAPPAAVAPEPTTPPADPTAQPEPEPASAEPPQPPPQLPP
jgi:hypothetical protein